MTGTATTSTRRACIASPTATCTCATRNTQGNADIRFFFGNPGDIPLAGDFNKDGCDTVSIYRPSEARIYVINKLGSNDGGLGAADYDFYFGNPGDKPFTGDFNNNGQDTVGLHRESTGFVYYRNTLTTGIADNDFFYGDPGDQIITGRWAQDPTKGSDTVGIFRPSNGRFYLRFENSQGNANVDYSVRQLEHGCGRRRLRRASGRRSGTAGNSDDPAAHDDHDHHHHHHHHAPARRFHHVEL